MVSRDSRLVDFQWGSVSECQKSAGVLRPSGAGTVLPGGQLFSEQSSPFLFLLLCPWGLQPASPWLTGRRREFRSGSCPANVGSCYCGRVGQPVHLQCPLDRWPEQPLLSGRRTRNPWIEVSGP
jgi:hypothetical protein